jgi:hypothetical protein
MLFQHLPSLSPALAALPLLAACSQITAPAAPIMKSAEKTEDSEVWSAIKDTAWK